MSKHKNPKEKTPIIVAVIGLVGTLFAAIIATSPNLVSMFKREVEPVTFDRYDDVLDVFSIDYPSDFFVDNRTVDDERIMVNFLRRAQGTDQILIDASRVSSDTTAREQAEQLIGMLVGDSNERLLSNKKTNNGYLIHSEQFDETGSVTHDHFVLYESQNDIFVYVVLSFPNSNSSFYNKDIIEHIFSSFTWSYDQLDLQLRK